MYFQLQKFFSLLRFRSNFDLFIFTYLKLDTVLCLDDYFSLFRNKHVCLPDSVIIFITGFFYLLSKTASC